MKLKAILAMLLLRPFTVPFSRCSYGTVLPLLWWSIGVWSLWRISSKDPQMWLRVCVAVLLIAIPSSFARPTWKVVASIRWSCLIKQGIWVDVFPESSALGSPTILGWLLFFNSPGNTFDLHNGDEGSLAYLACISPSWVPVPSSSGPRYTHYSAHRVLRQFGFDQDIPPLFKEIVPSFPSLDPFLRLQAVSYWSRKSPQFVVPNSRRGVFASSSFASC